MTRLPSLFVSHGSPMLPLEPGTAGPMLQSLGQNLPRPAAILAFSPHWMSRTLAVGASSQPITIHDFGGFDPALNELRYPATGDPALAQRAVNILQAAGWPAVLDPGRGLDHGVWAPLHFMYPQADVPVVPLAMPWPLDSAGAYRLGQTLGALAEDGVLLFGTGSLTHNLQDFHPDAATGDPPEQYVQEFVEWIHTTIDSGDTSGLLDYRRQAPHATRAHPSDEHLLPLFWAIGAAGKGAKAEHRAGGVHYGMLSMDSWLFA